MTQRRFLPFGWIACVILAASGQTTRSTELQRSPAEQHNVIFIVTDDQARWSIGAYGNREAITPNIDRLAREGAKFNNAFVTTPVCSPSRVALLTGLYGTEVGITDYLTLEEGADGRGLPESALTWPRVLQQNGYRTALFGKYHLGTAAEFHPTRRGFDYFMGSLQGSFAPVNPRLEVNGRMTDVKGAGSDVVMDDAIRWIEANRDKPSARSSTSASRIFPTPRCQTRMRGSSKISIRRSPMCPDSTARRSDSSIATTTPRFTPSIATSASY